MVRALSSSEYPTGWGNFSDLTVSRLLENGFVKSPSPLPPSPWHDLIISSPMYNNFPINLPKKVCPSMKSFFWKKVPHNLGVGDTLTSHFGIRVPGSKTLDDSKVDSVFHPSEVDRTSTRNSLGLKIKSKLFHHSGSANLSLLNSIHKKDS